MSESKQVAFRCGDALVQRLDDLALVMQEEDGGVSPGRSGVIRRLILLSLPILENKHGLTSAPKKNAA